MGETRWPAADWKQIEPFPFAEAGRPFTGGTRDESAIRIRYYERPDRSLIAVASFGPRSEGAPGQTHGGAILTVLDEALGAAAWHKGHRVVTGRLTTEFRLPVPVGAELLVETKLLVARGRFVSCEGCLVGDNGLTYAAAEGLFVVLRPEEQQKRFGSR